MTRYWTAQFLAVQSTLAIAMSSFAIAKVGCIAKNWDGQYRIYKNLLVPCNPIFDASNVNSWLFSNEL